VAIENCESSMNNEALTEANFQAKFFLKKSSFYFGISLIFGSAKGRSLLFITIQIPLYNLDLKFYSYSIFKLPY
jgi:hypothetical protein